MNKSDVTQILSTTRLTQYLNRNELAIFIKYSSIKVFPPGYFLLQQGLAAEGLYIILEGTVGITAKILGEGNTQLASLGHGNLIGEVSVIDKNPSSVSCIAHTEIRCLFITNQYMEILSVLYPKVYYRLKQVIADEMCENLRNFCNKTTLIMQKTDMITRSLFSTVIKSMNKPTLLEMTELEHYAGQLTNIDTFKSLTIEEKKELIKNSNLIKTNHDCTLIQENYIDSNLYIILYGAVQSSIIQDKKIAKLSVLGPLEVFCGISIFDDTSPSIINYTTCERSILLKISQKNLGALKKKPSIWYKIFNLICQSFVELERSAEKLDIRLHSELYNR